MKVELSSNQLNIKGRRKVKGNDIERYVMDLACYAGLEIIENEYKLQKTIYI